MQCTLGSPECLIEYSISAAEMAQAIKVAASFDVGTPLDKRSKSLKIAVPDGADPDGPAHPLLAYPYIWHVTPAQNLVRLEMGHDIHGKRIVALFTMKPNLNKLGVIVHVSVFLIDERLAESGIGSFAARHSADTNYHLAANKHFLFLLLGRRDLNPANNYFVPLPEAPPPPPDDEPAPPPDPGDNLGEIDTL